MVLRNVLWIFGILAFTFTGAVSNYAPAEPGVAATGTTWTSTEAIVHDGRHLLHLGDEAKYLNRLESLRNQYGCFSTGVRIQTW